MLWYDSWGDLLAQSVAGVITFEMGMYWQRREDRKKRLPKHKDLPFTWECPYCPRTRFGNADRGMLIAMVESHMTKFHPFHTHNGLDI